MSAPDGRKGVDLTGLWRRNPEDGSYKIDTYELDSGRKISYKITWWQYSPNRKAWTLYVNGKNVGFVSSGGRSILRLRDIQARAQDIENGASWT